MKNLLGQLCQEEENENNDILLHLCSQRLKSVHKAITNIHYFFLHLADVVYQK